MGLSKLHNILKVNGVVVIISFHSLEDRIVNEIKMNPRSRSAVMRVFEKL